jgi:hypothetical protein
MAMVDVVQNLFKIMNKKEGTSYKKAVRDNKWISLQKSEAKQSFL